MTESLSDAYCSTSFISLDDLPPSPSLSMSSSTSSSCNSKSPTQTVGRALTKAWKSVTLKLRKEDDSGVLDGFDVVASPAAPRYNSHSSP